jgi:isoleucyl-tRNA synthetase
MWLRDELEGIMLRPPPLRGKGYDFDVPLLDGDHVTDDAGTGFVHTAPGHGREDFDIWMDAVAISIRARHRPPYPFTVGADGGFTPRTRRASRAKQVITDKGEEGRRQQAVIKALIEATMLFARGRLKHTYPHSWRSKKPVIFRNTPQWFVYMDKDCRKRRRHAADPGAQGHRRNPLRARRAEPPARHDRGPARLGLSRQRAWGVPITVFVNDKGKVLKDEAVNKRIFEPSWKKAPMPGSLRAPRNASSATITRPMNGRRSPTFSMSGSIPARPMPSAWKSAKTSNGRPTSISKAPTSIAAGSIPRCWKAAAPAAARPMTRCSPTASPWPRRAARCPSRSATRCSRRTSSSSTAPTSCVCGWRHRLLGRPAHRPEIIKTNVDAYRKLRNTIRWMLGSLAHSSRRRAVEDKDMPELERLMLHRLARARRHGAQVL